MMFLRRSSSSSEKQQQPIDPPAPGDTVTTTGIDDSGVVASSRHARIVETVDHHVVVDDDDKKKKKESSSSSQSPHHTTKTSSTVATNTTTIGRNKESSTISGASAATAAATAQCHVSIRLLAMVVLVLWMSSFVLLAKTYTAGLIAKYKYHHHRQQNGSSNDIAAADDAASSSLISNWEYKPKKTAATAVVAANNNKNNTTTTTYYNYSTPVRFSALSWAQPIGYITQPGTIVEAYPYNYSIKYLYLIRPIQGFVEKKHFARLSSEIHEHYNNLASASPLLYLGYRTNTKKSRLGRSMYAPVSLVVAQQFWNAVEVVHLFLVMALYYQYIFSNSKLLSRRQRFGLSTTTLLVHAVLLPLSHYISSPGAFIFSIIILTTAMIGLHSDQVLVLDVGPKQQQQKQQQLQQQQQSKTVALDPIAEDDDEKSDDTSTTTLDLDNYDNDEDDKEDYDNDEEQAAFLVSSSPSSNRNNDNTAPTWFIIQKDMIGLLSITCSWLYNYNGSAGTIPYLVYQYYKIDKFFGWTGSGSSIKEQLYLFHDALYTLGLPGWRVPMYVPRLRGSTFGTHLFVMLWSIIPFLYICYYIALYVMARHSPGCMIQRVLLLFAICHFLFWTDAVDYRYGRGYNTPHAEWFHWMERWSWRIAMLMPLYQSCTNGHWKHAAGHSSHHHRYWCWPLWSGQAFHYAMAAYGIGFFVFQVIFSDAFRFAFFLSGHKAQTLYEILGISSIGWKHFHPFSYHGSLFLFAVMIYPFMILSGLFTPQYISLQMSNINQVNKNNHNHKNTTTTATTTPWMMIVDRIILGDEFLASLLPRRSIARRFLIFTTMVVAVFIILYC